MATKPVAPVRTVLVERHVLLRSGLSMLLSRAPGIQVVGEAASVADALGVIDELRPDVAIVDLSPSAGIDHDGLLFIEQIAMRHPSVSTVALLTVHDDGLITSAMRAGAGGYAVKDTDATALISVIGTLPR